MVRFIQRLILAVTVLWWILVIITFPIWGIAYYRKAITP